MKRSLFLTLAVIAGALPVGAASLGSVAHAAPVTELPPCGSESDTDCIVSVTRNGTPVALPTQPSDDFDVFAGYFVNDITGFKEYSFSIKRGQSVPGDPYSLDPADTWEIVLDLGDYYPAETFSRGRNVSVTRSGNATDGFHVGFDLQPVRMATGACDSSGSCGGEDSVADTLHTGYIDGWVNELAYVEDPDDKAARRGFDLSSNADWVSSPPQLEWETRSLIIDVGNAHFEPDGTTPFVGSAEMRLPFSMLRRLYYVDDPASMTASAFRVVTPGTTSPDVNMVVGATDIDVKITNIPFSKRRIKVAGNVRPTAPKNLRAVRKSAHRAVLKFDPAKSRGSKVTGYVGICKRPGNAVRETAKAAPIVLTGLVRGKGYDCKVLAKSKAGLGRVAKDHLAARP